MAKLNAIETLLLKIDSLLLVFYSIDSICIVFIVCLFFFLLRKIVSQKKYNWLVELLTSL